MPLGRAPPPGLVVVAEEGKGEIGLLPAGLGMWLGVEGAAERREGGRGKELLN